MSKNKRYLLLFLILVVLPGMGLVALGVRTLHQEKIATEQDLRDQLKAVSDKIEENINREFKRWNDCLQDFPDRVQVDPGHLPLCLSDALTEQQGSILVKREDSAIETIPENALLYSLQPLDIRENPEIRKLYKQGVSLRERGRNTEAITLYESMRQYPQEILGGVPADLVAELEICSLYHEMSQSDVLGARSLYLYENLVEGRWLIERPLYLHYASRAREWLKETGQIEAINGLIRRENYKRRMTEIVGNLVSRTDSFLENYSNRIEVFQTEKGSVFALLHRMNEEQTILVLLLSPTTLADRFWPGIFSEDIAEKYYATLTTSDGLPLYASGGRTKPEQTKEERFIQIAGDNWILNVHSRDEQQFYSDYQRKQIIYISIFILFILSLGSAVYFSVRTLYQGMEVARLKENFVSAVSHEFRTPLTGIRQLTEMLVADRVSGDEKRSQYYSMILQELDEMSRMVENLLAYARATDKGHPFGIERMNTNRWLHEAVSQFRRSIAANDADVILNIAYSLPPIRGDSSALSLALANLLDNAVKYSPKDTPVEVDTDMEDEWITIRVRDKGIGIQDEEKNKIFDRFYRGNDAFVQRKRGTGLGLSLVQDIVAAHQGKICVESRPGEGSVFTISLPAATASDDGEPS